MQKRITKLPHPENRLHPDNFKTVKLLELQGFKGCWDEPLMEVLFEGVGEVHKKWGKNQWVIVYATDGNKTMFNVCLVKDDKPLQEKYPGLDWVQFYKDTDYTAKTFSELLYPMRLLIMETDFGLDNGFYAEPNLEPESFHIKDPEYLVQERDDSDTGVEAITCERERHVESKDYTLAHDAKHTKGELVKAALHYLNARSPAPWPIRLSKNPLENLAKAGALVAAEIDRLKIKPVK